MLSPRQAIEFFHLVFLRALSTGPDKAHYILKGGCNLRFFFRSPRHSEDIDFDVVVTSKTTLTHKVDRLLASPWVTKPLKTQELVLTHISRPKQTVTTQRWKLALGSTNHSEVIRTKVEFSRRAPGAEAVTDTIDRQVLEAYRLTPIAATHYGIDGAIKQKLAALIGRALPQARDVFDLWLLSSMTPSQLRIAKLNLDMLSERIIALSYDDYQGQVVAYLEAEQQALYAERATWERMQHDVLQSMRGWSL